ncbi:hypothetical protein LJR230_002799 [Trinickia sp. LjRoot230]
MKAWLAALAVVWLCAACAQGGASASADEHPSGITMYGTIDRGVTFRK